MTFPRDVQRFEYYIAAAGVAIFPSILCRILVQRVFFPSPELELVLSALLATLGGAVAAYLLSQKEHSGIIKLGTTTGLLSFTVGLVFGLVRIGDWWASLFGYLSGGYVGVYLNKKLNSKIISSPSRKSVALMGLLLDEIVARRVVPKLTCL